MSSITEAQPVKPFAAIFAQNTAALAEGLMAFSRIMGEEPDILSPEFPVVETAYYEKEMGPGLRKVYASWPSLMSPESLVDIKLRAMEWEQQNAPGGHRRFNLDPGYIFSGGLVLSTAKFRGHRLPLGRGIWGELTLNFHQGGFLSFPWTYLDYQRPEIQEWLITMRKRCMADLNKKA
ncbi:MAG: DUF4416 family protein [Candidatus Adiutrix sp.]|nr:DUF4416 family protein [Candidatus Adiutrix sp.]